jgi:hypothetical protein
MIFSHEGFKALRATFLLALASIGVAAFVIAGSYYYRQAEVKGDTQSRNLLQDLRKRLDTLRREREDLRNSADVYKVLVARGAFMPEQRLDLVEAFAELKKRHRLLSLEFEVSPQRVLRMASGISFPGIDIMGSRIKLKVRAYHDEDLIALLDEFPRLQRGFFPIERCAIKRAAENDRSAGIDAECHLDWVTLVDKHHPAPAITGSGQPKPL